MSDLEIQQAVSGWTWFLIETIRILKASRDAWRSAHGMLVAKPLNGDPIKVTNDSASVVSEDAEQALGADSP